MSRSPKLRPVLLSLLSFLLLALVATSGCKRKPTVASHLEKGASLYAEGKLEDAEEEYISAYNLDLQSSEAMIGLARIFHQQGRLRHAYKALNTCLELDPANLEARTMLSETYLRARKSSDAREQALLALAADPAYAPALLALAEAAQNRSAAKQTLAHFQTMPDAVKASPGYLVAQARLYSKLGDARQASSLLDSALAIEPANPEALIAYARLHWSRQAIDQAAASFQKAVEAAGFAPGPAIEYANFRRKNRHFEEALQVLEQSLEKNPEHMPSLLEYADLCLQLHKYEQGIEKTDTVLRLDQKNPGALLLAGKLKNAAGQSRSAATTLKRMTTLYPKSAKAYLQLAIAYLGDSRPKEAIDALYTASYLAPDSSETNLLLAELEVEQADFNGAILVLEEYVKNNPEDHDATLFLLETLRNKGDHEKALPLNVQLIEKYPENSDYLHQMGVSLIQLQRFSEARTFLEKALSIDPYHYPTLEQLVMFEVAQKRFAEALERVDSFPSGDTPNAKLSFLRGFLLYQVDDLAAAEAEFNRSIEIDPKNMRPYLLLVEIYVEEDRVEQAIESLHLAARNNPSNINNLMLLGTLYEKTDQYEQAAAHFQKALDIDPLLVPALNNLAYLYSKHLPDLKTAYKLASQARKLQPSNADVADTLGWILYQKGNYNWAMSLIAEASIGLSENPEFLYHLGMTHYMLGDAEKAREALAKAVSATQSFPGQDLINPRLQILDIDPLADPEQARAQLETQLAIEPDDTIALFGLSAIHKQSGQLPQAADFLRRILRVNADNARAHLHLANVQEAAGQTQAAFDSAKKAYALNPDDSATLATLGRMAYQQGDLRWADSILRRAVRLDPGNQPLRYTLAECLFATSELEKARETLAAPFSSQDVQAKAQRLATLIEIFGNPGNPLPAELPAPAAKQTKNLLADLIAVLETEAAGPLEAATGAYQQVLAQYPLFSAGAGRLALLYQQSGTFTSEAYDATTRAYIHYRKQPVISNAMAQQSYHEGIRLAEEKRPGASRQALEVALRIGLPEEQAEHARELIETPPPEKG